jgi:hypothetical protein
MARRQSNVHILPNASFPFVKIIVVLESCLKHRRGIQKPKVMQGPWWLLTSEETTGTEFLVVMNRCIMKVDHAPDSKRPHILGDVAWPFSHGVKRIVQTH